MRWWRYFNADYVGRTGFSVSAFRLKCLVMKRYRNLSNCSGVSAYRIEGDAILVEFTDGGVYEYNATAPGFHHVERMKQFAELGRGLATYINQFVRSNYAKRIK